MAAVPDCKEEFQTRPAEKLLVPWCVKEIVGPIRSEQILKTIRCSQEPIHFVNMIDSWPSRQWTIQTFAARFSDIHTRFRICQQDQSRKVSDENSELAEDNKVVMETDCVYVDAKFTDFVDWLDSAPRLDLDVDQGNESRKNSGNTNAHVENPLNLYPRNTHWCYADYKYMHILFKDYPDVLSEIDWGVFGFDGRNGSQSTIWIGSNGAYTHCHQDSYGFNLIAQITGSKRWVLFPPKESHRLYPTRIPYEESSIFSKVNIKTPDLKLHPKFASVRRIEVILEPGQVLFVPKHWWHFVECLEPSISINTWIEEESDDIDRVKEAVTRIIVCSLKNSEEANENSWLNPTEENTSFEENFRYLKKALLLTKLQRNTDTDNEIFSEDDMLTANSFIDCFTSERVMDAIISELTEKLNISLQDISPYLTEGTTFKSSAIFPGENEKTEFHENEQRGFSAGDGCKSTGIQTMQQCSSYQEQPPCKIARHEN